MAQVSMPLEFIRQYPGDLDPMNVFDSMETATEYVAGPLSYPRQIIRVKVSDTESHAYMIQENKTLTRIATEADITAAAPEWETLG